jgi:uncharacterized membrane protein
MTSVVNHARPAWTRLSVAVGSGLGTLVVSIALGAPWEVAVQSGWVGTSAVFLLLMWLTLGRLDAEKTWEHAAREDPSRTLTDLVLIVSSLLSLASVAFVISGIGAHGTAAANARLGLSVLSVVLSWATVHALFTLRYAKLYYTDEVGGFDWHTDESPTYVDFAYVSFTVGMSFAISDTDVTSAAIRRAVLKQALLSYLFGSIIIAATINLVAGLAG